MERNAEFGVFGDCLKNLYAGRPRGNVFFNVSMLRFFKRR